MLQRGSPIDLSDLTAASRCPLFGRDEELTTLRAMAEPGEIATIVGPPGCGKTRLAVELAAGQESALFVDLTEAGDESDLVPIVSEAAGRAGFPVHGPYADAGELGAALAGLVSLGGARQLRAPRGQW